MAAEPEALARELALLRMLRDHVDEEIDARRLRLARNAEVGWKHRAELPNPADPAKPLAAATTRIDPGHVTAKVTNPVTFLAWVRREFPGEIVTRQPSSNRAPDGARLDIATDAAVRVSRGLGPFDSPTGPLLRALEACGYTIAELVTTTPEPEVDPRFAEKVLAECKANKAANYQGVEVDGVTVTEEDPRVVVTPSKDTALVRQYVQRMVGNGTAQALLSGP
jgi:hypothetical protein